MRHRLLNEPRSKAVPRVRALLGLRDRLLAVAGAEACMPNVEEDLGRLLLFGEYWLGSGSILKPGRPCHCHSNSLRLWASNRSKYAVATGYALSHDGMWRQHSWGLIGETGCKGGRVVETTERRVLYFGFTMTPVEAQARLLEV